MTFILLENDIFWFEFCPKGTKNIDLIDDIFNGVGGTVVGVEYTESQEVYAVIVQFDEEHYGRRRREKNPELAKKYKKVNGTPIFKEDHPYQFSSRSGKKLLRGKLRQFPLRLFYACTAHKIQVNYDLYTLHFCNFSNT